MLAEREMYLLYLLENRAAYRRRRNACPGDFRESMAFVFLMAIDQEISGVIAEINIESAFTRWRFIRIDGRVKKQYRRKQKH